MPRTIAVKITAVHHNKTSGMSFHKHRAKPHERKRVQRYHNREYAATITDPVCIAKPPQIKLFYEMLVTHTIKRIGAKNILVIRDIYCPNLFRFYETTLYMIP